MQNMNGKTALGLDANVGALLCYLGNFVCSLGLIYSIIVVVTDKTNKLARFHAFQSILLSVVAAVLFIGTWIVGAVLIMATESMAIAGLLTVIYIVLGLAILAAIIFAAIKGFQGQLFKLPIIGNLADNWSN